MRGYCKCKRIITRIKPDFSTECATCGKEIRVIDTIDEKKLEKVIEEVREELYREVDKLAYGEEIRGV